MPRSTFQPPSRGRALPTEHDAARPAGDVGWGRRRIEALGRGEGVVAALVAAVCLVMAVRLGVVLTVDQPVYFGDDIGYLLNARHLAGEGAPPHHLLVPFYHVGYSLLLVPVFMVAGDPQTIFATVQGINAVVGATVVLPLYLLGRDLLRLSRPAALGAATVAAVFTGLVLQAPVAWAENVLPTLAALLLWTLHRFLVRPGAGPAVAVAGCAGALYLTHPRFLPVAALVAVVVAVAAIRGFVPRLSAGLLVGALAVAGAVSWLANEAVYSAVYTAPGVDNPFAANFAARALTSPDSWPVALNAAAGQWWYLGTATLGVGLVGALALARMAARGEGRGASRADTASRITAVVALLSFAGILLVGSLQFGTFQLPVLRADHLIYGRYIDALTPAMIIAGLAAVLRRLGPLRALVVGAALTYAVALAALLLGPGRDALVDGFFIPLTAPGVAALLALTETGTRGAEVLAMTAVGAGLSAGVALLARRRPRAAVAALGACFVVLSLAAGPRVVGEFADRQAARTTLHLALERTGGGEDVSYDLASFSPAGLGPLQFLVPAREFRAYNSLLGEPPPTALIIASAERPPTGPGDVLLARERGAGQALWRRAAGAPAPAGVRPPG